MSRALLPGLFAAVAVVTACSTQATQATTSTSATKPCACAGIAVDEGTVDAACGTSVCLGTSGYRCADDGLSVEPDPAACPHNWSAGTGGKTGLAEKTLDDKGTARIYGINVPASYTGEVGVPLVLHFHGWRPAPAEVKDEVKYLWKPVADKAGFITVAPEGSPCPELNPKGDPFLCFDEQKDDAWLTKLIETIASQYNVDRDRIFLSGHSGGSFFTQGYGLLHPEKFHAAVIFSGGCISASDEYGNSCSVYREIAKKVDRKIPYYVVHNPGDKVVPQGYSIAMSKVLKDAGFPLKTYFTAYEGGSNGHSVDPKLVPDVWTWLAASDPAFVSK
jgi:predicted peptidase